MGNAVELFQKPKNLTTNDDWKEWFSRIAEYLLNEATVMIAGNLHRFTEIEFYYSGDGHDDQFAHRDPIQLQNGVWYFHRTRGTYRSGSFKGVDVAFGDGKAFAGVLIRGLFPFDGGQIDGPSLHVDYWLKQTGQDTVAALDEAMNGRSVWDSDSPIHLVESDVKRDHPIIRSARVGLTLKKAKPDSDLPNYIVRRYRYLTEPRTIKKGKPHMVLGLHTDGISPDEIHQVTGCPKHSIKRYIDDFDAGKEEADFAPYFGKELNTELLCRLHGTWHTCYG
ncbi:MAG: hypothetical protein ACFCD0_25050 [Gemmataceae bacterium]